MSGMMIPINDAAYWLNLFGIQQYSRIVTCLFEGQVLFWANDRYNAKPEQLAGLNQTLTTKVRLRSSNDVRSDGQWQRYVYIEADASIEVQAHQLA